MAAHVAQGRREAIDIGHNRAGHRRFGHEAFRHEMVLHVDDDEGRLAGIECVKGMRASGATGDLVDHILRNRDLVHGAALLVPEPSA